MNIVRKIHDLFRVKTVAGAQLETPSAVSYSGESSSTYITIAGGSLNGSSLSEEDRNKLNSIELGAQVNQDAFSKVLLETTNIELEQQTTTSSSIIANIPSDTANIRLVGNYPIKVSLESVSLFNYNTVTTTGDIVASYNVSYNEDSNIVIDYVSGTLFSTTDIEIIRILHREETLATYNNTQFECTESEGTIIQFIIPYQGTDFSSILFCRYETSSSESTEGTETVRELSVITELPVSPTKQLIITLSDTNANYWKYEEDENGNRYLWTDCNVYSTKEVSAYGKAEGQEIPTILNLSLLQDVALTNLSNNLVLVYNASSQKWVNIDANNLGISVDNLKTLTITVNGTSYTYNPASSNQSISITTITLDDILPYISNKLDREEFFKWFTINYDSDNNVTSILANYDFYSIKGISAYGLGDIGGITRTTLQSLDDVSLSNLVVDNMLAYNGSKWVNIPMSQVRGVTSWSDLENKPTTISGFGITDAYTKTEVNTKISEVSSKVTELSSSKADATTQVIAGDGLTGGGNLQQDITIALLNLNSTGTYYKVNVDTYGRVTSGISLLTIADILNLQTQLDSKLNIADFNTWFTIIYNTDGTIKNIRANYDFYSVGEVSAYGIGDEEKKTYTTLAELNDVQLTNIKATDVLVYNGTKWVNVDQSTIKGALSWVDIQNKPTTISGFGIVDAYTKTEVDALVLLVSNKLDDFLTGSDTDDIINKWKELELFLAGYTETLTLADLLSVKANSSILIIAGTGLVGGGDLTANRTISLGTSGVSAGTYTKVTVDAYGRVTSGSTLSATDIPNLDWSKITSGKPTTLEGYGITDGVNSITITGIGNAITTATITDHILTLTKGDTFLQQSIFDDLFEKVNIGTTSDPIYAIKAKYHFYSVGEVSAYEFGDASGGGSGASALYQLNDVAANGTNDGVLGAATGKVLMYNGSKWLAGSVVTDISTLTLQINGSALATFNGKSNVVANIAVPTKLSQLTDDVVSGKYLPLSGGLMTGQIRKNGVSSSWIKGRDNAMIRTSSLNGYSVMASIKTTNGTWEIGAYDQSSYFDDLIFSYCTDTNYSNNNNTSTAQIKFYEDGTIGASITGNAATASKWATARALTLTGSVTGSATMDGSGNVTLNTTTNHTHSYLPLSGGTLTGALTLAGDKWYNSASAYALDLNNSDVIGVNSIYFNDLCDNAAEGIHFYRDATHVDSLWVKQGTIYFNNYRSITSTDATGSILLHSGNFNNYAPSLTGTGASGKWSISITGNAATATDADTLDGTHWQYILERSYSGAANFGSNFDSDTGWKRIAETLATDAVGCNFLLAIHRSYSNINNEAYLFSISITHNGRISITQLSGYANSRLITKIRVDYKPSNIAYVDFYINTSSAGNTYYWYTVGNAKSYTSVKANPTLVGTSYEFTTVNGSKSDKGYTGDIDGNSRTTNYFNYIYAVNVDCNNPTHALHSDYGSGKTITNAPTGWKYGSLLTIGRGGSLSNPLSAQLMWDVKHATTYAGRLWFRTKDENTGWRGWTEVLTEQSGNAVSATQLQTARTLWGQSFNGTANVSGTLTGVGGIYMTDSIYNANNHNVLNCTSSFLILGYGSSANGYDTYLDGKTLYLRSGIAHNYVMTITSSGYVGIGTISPACKLYVDGNIAATGEITAYSSSDIRLKTNLNKLNSLSIIRKLGVYSFDWNEEALQLKVNKNIHDYGLIAQLVQLYIPEVINTNMFNKGYLGIDYLRLVPFTISAIKEVDDEVTKLKKRVKQLERRLLKYESTEVFYTKGND